MFMSNPHSDALTKRQRRRDRAKKMCGKCGRADWKAHLLDREEKILCYRLGKIVDFNCRCDLYVTVFEAYKEKSKSNQLQLF